MTVPPDATLLDTRSFGIHSPQSAQHINLRECSSNPSVAASPSINRSKCTNGAPGRKPSSQLWLSIFSYTVRATETIDRFSSLRRTVKYSINILNAALAPGMQCMLFIRTLLWYFDTPKSSRTGSGRYAVVSFLLFVSPTITTCIRYYIKSGYAGIGPTDRLYYTMDDQLAPLPYSFASYQMRDVGWCITFLLGDGTLVGGVSADIVSPLE